MAAIHFKRGTVQLDAINNGDYWPGEKLIVYTDEQSMVAGTLMSETFAFGNQAKATMNVRALETKTGAYLTINYKYDDAVIHTEKYRLPVGHAYVIQTIYIDKTYDSGRRRVFRPTVDSVTGTLTANGATQNVTCEIALEMYNNQLSIYDVDGVEVNNNMAVIA